MECFPKEVGTDLGTVASPLDASGLLNNMCIAGNMTSNYDDESSSLATQLISELPSAR